jgi:adenosylcobinamide-phosphate synthase
MKFLALLAVLLIEQAWPLRQGNPLQAAFARFAQYLRQLLDAGQYRQGVMAWFAAVAPATALVIACEWLLGRASGLLALAFSVGVLYITVGFRRFSYLFNEINILLRSNDVAAARVPLRLWRATDCSAMDANEISRVAIEQGLMDSHRNVFGPIACFVVFGSAGALLYRMAVVLQEQWRGRSAAVPAPSDSKDATDATDEFAKFAARAFEVIDWLPARLTAASFAIAGNFQDAVDCWRSQASAWGNPSDLGDQAEAVILASGAGALGVKLGGTLREDGSERERPELGTGDDADPDYLSSAVGLIWRALVMWMLLIGVVTIAHSLG